MTGSCQAMEGDSCYGCPHVGQCAYNPGPEPWSTKFVVSETRFVFRARDGRQVRHVPLTPERVAAAIKWTVATHRSVVIASPVHDRDTVVSDGLLPDGKRATVASVMQVLADLDAEGEHPWVCRTNVATGETVWRE